MASPYSPYQFLVSWWKRRVKIWYPFYSYKATGKIYKVRMNIPFICYFEKSNFIKKEDRILYFLGDSNY